MTRTEVDVSQINATGTPSSTTFLRGDATWSAAGGGTGQTVGDTHTATAAATTTLTVSSTQIQVFTGTTTQTVVLPTTSVTAGMQWLIINQSTGNITVQASSGATIVILSGGTSAVFNAAVNTPTLATDWDAQYSGVVVVSGKALTVSNIMTLSATDGANINLQAPVSNAWNVVDNTDSSKKLAFDLSAVSSGNTRSLTVPDGSGLMDCEQFITNTATRTLTSQTAAQKLFGTPTNGAVTLPIGTYFFDCFFTLSSMSATSGSFGFALGVGTAVLAGQAWQTEGNKSTLATAAAAQNTANVTAANTAIVTATTATVGWAHVWGKFRVSTAGTVIPQVSLGVAAAAIVGADSYFRVWPAGASTVTSLGAWT